jgi:hypothetical protein
MAASNSSISVNHTSFDQLYPTLDQILTSIGSAYYIDCLWFYVNVPVSAIGIICNLLALIVLQDRELSIPLFKYLRLYCVNSVILNLAILMLFSSSVPRIFSWSNTSEVLASIGCYVITPVANLIYFFNTVIDILITFDRIGTFKPIAVKWMKLTPYKMSLAAFICCLAIDFPFFFAFSPGSFTVYLNSTYAQTFRYSGLSSFAYTEVGKVLILIIYIVRDFLLMVVEIALSIASVYLLKQYMVRRASMFSKRGSDAAVRASQMVNVASTVTAATNDHARNGNSSNADLNLSIMVSLMCLFSIIEHLAVLIASAYPYIGSDNILIHLLYFLAFFLTSVKHSLNFLLLYTFNKKFRSIARKLVKLD